MRRTVIANSEYLQREDFGRMRRTVIANSEYLQREDSGRMRRTVRNLVKVVLCQVKNDITI